MCLFPEWESRVNPYWLFFQVSFNQHSQKNEPKVLQIFRRQLCFLTTVFHSHLPAKVKGKPWLFIQTCTRQNSQNLYHQSQGSTPVTGQALPTLVLWLLIFPANLSANRHHSLIPQPPLLCTEKGGKQHPTAPPNCAPAARGSCSFSAGG